MDFLNDKAFLLKLNRYKIKEYRAAIVVLDYETEDPIAVLTGKVISCNLNFVNTSSSRKTGSLSLILDNSNYNISDIKNLISIDKKISLSLNISNPYYNTKEYRQYGEMLSFKQGIFFITQASSSISASGASISMNITDKMGGLNGTVGGVLPASTSFHEYETTDSEGNKTIKNPLIKDIIFEAVHHFGGEHPSRIIIQDVDEVGRRVVRYLGNTPMQIYPPETGKGFGRSFSLSEVPPTIPNTDVYYKDDIIGYMETPLTYPGELILAAGSTVCSVLDEIVSALGNFEYFYDVDGNFIFRRIRNYEMTGNVPLNYDSTTDEDLQALYMPKFSDQRFINEFADAFLIQNIGFSPKYDNIKNDFVYWGTKNSSDNTQTMVRYHLAIDERPRDSESSLCRTKIYAVKDKETPDVISFYCTERAMPDPASYLTELVAPDLSQTFGAIPEAQFNWREELYRQALLAWGNSSQGSYYDEELLAEWRLLYDPLNTAFQTKWEEHYGVTVPWTGYTLDIKVAPSKIRYWLDLIDTETEFGKYSVKRIGRRTKVVQDAKINEVFAIDPPDIVFIENNGNLKEVMTNIAYYNSIGQDYSFVNREILNSFSFENSFGTCYEGVRQMLYTSLCMNASVNITSIPIFYLEPNSILRVNVPEYGISGDYVINNISLSIGKDSGSMQLQVNEAVTII